MSRLSNSAEWFVYIIRCSDASLYTGITTDVARRFDEHAGKTATRSATQKGAKYFRGRSPKAVVYIEGAHTRSTASKREAAVKKMTRSEKLALIRDYRASESK